MFGSKFCTERHLSGIIGLRCVFCIIASVELCPVYVVAVEERIYSRKCRLFVRLPFGNTLLWQTQSVFLEAINAKQKPKSEHACRSIRKPRKANCPSLFQPIHHSP